MDLPDELEYLPYRLKGLEVDELTELLEGCGFLSDAGCSLNISLILTPCAAAYLSQIALRSEASGTSG